MKSILIIINSLYKTKTIQHKLIVFISFHFRFHSFIKFLRIEEKNKFRCKTRLLQVSILTTLANPIL